MSSNILREQLEAELAARGLRMEHSLSALAGGEGHALIDIATGEAVDPPDATVLELATQWSLMEGATAD